MFLLFVGEFPRASDYQTNHISPPERTFTIHSMAYHFGYSSLSIVSFLFTANQLLFLLFVFLKYSKDITFERGGRSNSIRCKRSFMLYWLGTGANASRKSIPPLLKFMLLIYANLSMQLLSLTIM